MADTGHNPTASTDAQLVTNAGTPFDHADADVIIRSSDNVDFRVFKLLLSLGSPFFKDMFALPQSASEGDPSREMMDGLPVVQVTEGRKVLEMLLSSCYPMDPLPALEKLEDVDSLLDAAVKYSIERVEKRARKMLLDQRFLSVDPVRVFAIACRYRMEEEARTAAKATLRVTILERPSGPELEFISAGKLYSLLQYHKHCVTAAREASGGFTWPTAPDKAQSCRCGSHVYAPGEATTSSVAFQTALLSRIPDKAEIEAALEKAQYVAKCGRCSTVTNVSSNITGPKDICKSVCSLFSMMESAISSVSLELHESDELNPVSVREGGINAITNAGAPFDDPKADVILRSSDNVDFRVIRIFLSYGSEFFSDLFSLPQVTEADGDGMRDGLPVIPMAEEAETLKMLLLLCYPMGAVDPPVLKKLEAIDSLLGVAMKYNVARVEKRAREILISSQFLSTDPARVFAIACRHKIEEEARKAARATLTVAVLDMPELEFISARQLYQLLQYHKQCVAAARKASRGFTWPTPPKRNRSTAQYCSSCRNTNPLWNWSSTMKSDDMLAAILRDRLPDQTDFKNIVTGTANFPACPHCSALAGCIIPTNVDELIKKLCDTIDNSTSLIKLELSL